jgi:hypothetical protein
MKLWSFHIRIVLFAIAAVLVSVIAIASVWLSKPSNTTGNDGASRQLGPPAAPHVLQASDDHTQSVVWPDIPIFPGATVSKWGCHDDVPTDCNYTMITTTTPEEVAAFYTGELQKSGWVVAGEGIPVYGLGKTVWFLWNSQSNDIPVRRYFSVSAIPKQDRKETSLLMETYLWPDPYKVPIYPDAEAVTKTWEQGGFGEASCRIVMYISASTQSEISSFYKQMLRLDGWRKSAVLENGYGYRRGLPDAPDAVMSDLDLSYKQEPDGKTQVQTKACSYELTDPSK